ncbi:MAG: preprotein translocase subunit SecA [Eubacteriales bacterium]
MSLITKLFGTTSKRELKAIDPIVDKVLGLEPQFQAYSDDELKNCTLKFKERLEKGETLDDILPEAFAACREACWRVLGMKPYPVQIVGGIVLHQGRIAEMRTGEGKTLVATLPSYLNALTGKGVHVITVNDYLARRDSEWMGKVHNFMGLTVGLVVHGVEDKKSAYAADITYGTNNEFGFDYLRDNMAIYQREVTQRGHVFAVVDEVDSILVDEARTPLIISGQGDKSTKLYSYADHFVTGLKCKKITSVDAKEEEDTDIDADYIVDEKARTATLTARGIEKAETAFQVENLGDIEHTTLAHHINQAIRAHGVMKRDIDYVVRDGEVIIVDEFTGRMMEGRRYNEGLHQAIEAKEKVQIANESKTLATVTFQNYFRLYNKLSGMTGTAMTEAEEFGTIYELDIVEIPTNRPSQRVDNNDVVYKTERAKFKAVVEQIQKCYEKKQPALVGTVSIEKSEEISALLKKAKIPHNVLNAKNHEKEAEIVAQAGKLGAVTVATNMAGRGTDIVLGGNAEFLAKRDLRRQEMSEELIAQATGHSDTDDEEILEARRKFAEAEAKYAKEIEGEAAQVREAGGLFILGTERHESRRIDNQLRGRAGRQGDPGQTRFFLSLDDDIMRLFGTDRVRGLMDTLGVDDDMPIEQKMLTNSIERAQKQVESRNFQTRKSVLQYDDVMNTQREVIYGQRRTVLAGEDLKDTVQSIIDRHVDESIKGHMGDKTHLTATEFQQAILPYRGMFIPEGEFNLTDEELQKYDVEGLIDLVLDKADEVYAEKEKTNSAETMRELERIMTLRVVDEYWMEHIDAMTELRQGIGLRAYAQTDPVVAYKQEGYEMFTEMINAIQEETVRRLFRVQIRRPEDAQRQRVANITNQSGGSSDQGNVATARKVIKIGRNDPCPCGSGLKWKKCECEKFHKHLLTPPENGEQK